MKKDIFIDNNITKNFANPLDSEYKKLIDWLLRFDRNNIANNAHLVASNELINEYNRTSQYTYSSTNIIIIWGILQAQGRARKFSNREIQDFKQRHYTKTRRKRFRSNYADKEFHIPTVLMSCRKYALVGDNALRNDLINFPGFTVLTERRPQDIPYDG